MQHLVIVLVDYPAAIAAQTMLERGGQRSATHRCIPLSVCWYHRHVD